MNTTRRLAVILDAPTWWASDQIAAVHESLVDPLRTSATTKDISFNQSLDVFQMSSLDSYIVALSGAATWPLAVRAQQPKKGGTMTEVLRFEPGNYDFVHAPGGPFSAGVAPMNGYALRRVRFGRPIPMAEGFAFIEAYLGREGRPLTALAACELRSPAAMTMAEFQTFNRQYLQTLHAWGCRLGEINTMARSNIAPITEVPNESSFFAFTYTLPERDAAGDFLISGKPENRDGVTGPESIFGGRDVSLRGLEAKARFVVNALRERVMALNCDWSGITAAQIYTVHDIRPLLENILAEARLSQIGVAWYPAWQPVLGLEFEADVRRVRVEIVV